MLVFASLVGEMLDEENCNCKPKGCDPAACMNNGTLAQGHYVTISLFGTALGRATYVASNNTM